MPIYTVHLPPDTTGSRFQQAERALVVPDTFSWRAFLFGPLWLIGNRLWLSFLVWAVVVTAIELGAAEMQASSLVVLLALFLLALFLGFEGRQLLRGKWERRGFRPWDVIAAGSTSEAEQVFFARWLASAEAPAKPKPQPPAPPRPGTGHDDVIGLFPFAEGGR